MKISSLGKRSRVPVRSIKYCLRERLLPSGTPTAVNQAEYGETHVARLRLIRVLLGMGVMSLGAVRDVLAVVDDQHVSARRVSHALNQILFASRQSLWRWSYTSRQTHTVDALIVQLGWWTEPPQPGRRTLAQALAALEDLGVHCDPATLLPYAEAADRLMAIEAQSIRHDPPPIAVAKTVLFQVAFAAMRTLAYEHHMAACELRHGSTLRKRPDGKPSLHAENGDPGDLHRA